MHDINSKHGKNLKCLWKGLEVWNKKKKLNRFELKKNTHKTTVRNVQEYTLYAVKLFDTCRLIAGG